MSLHNNLLKGSLSAIILKLLEDHPRMYGYEISQRIKEITQGQMLITEGALYPALHKLEAEGILTTETEVFEGRARKYYSLTKQGETEAQTRVEGLLQTLSYLQQILQPKIS